jgi:hypothetical protein
MQMIGRAAFQEASDFKETSNRSFIMSKFGKVTTLTLGTNFSAQNLDGKRVDVDGQSYKSGGTVISKQP